MLTENETSTLILHMKDFRLHMKIFHCNIAFLLHNDLYYKPHTQGAHFVSTTNSYTRGLHENIHLSLYQISNLLLGEVVDGELIITR